MSGLLPISFAAPWMLAALVALPVIWWLLRFTPPRPREVAFPPLRLLLGLRRDDEKPQTSPWWLTLLRMALAAAVILALAGPTWNPSPAAAPGRGPMAIVIDDGWPAARGWERRRAAAERLIDEAQRDQRPVMLVSTAAGADQPFRPQAATEARDRLRGLAPRPFLPDRAETAAPLQRALRDAEDASLIWLTDGFENGGGRSFAAALREIVPTARTTVHLEPALTPAILGAPTNAADALTAPVQRIDPLAPSRGAVRALDARGRSIGVSEFAFEGTARETVARFALPVELRNDVFRLEIDDGATAGGVQLLDDRFRRRTVGVVAGASEFDSPLLSPLFILAQALAPFADVRESAAAGTAGVVGDFLDQRVSTVVMADIAAIPAETHQRLERWLREGGVLVRFAGTRLAAAQGQDPFVPVRLRQTARVLGGTLSWEQPQAIGRFTPGGPFAGMPIPRDVTVARQILAEPEAGLAQKTWVELADGTPLVTAEPRGEGWIVLVHVTADPNWSNLPLSGTFLEMLRRTITLSAAAGGGGEERLQRAGGPEPVLPPLRTLDAFGVSGPPPASAKPIAVSAMARAVPSRDHPPGVYGRDEAFRALNTVRAGDVFEPLAADALGGAAVAGYAPREEIALKPWLIAAALIALLVDTVIVLALGGAMRLRRAAPRVAAALAFLIAGASVQGARAETELAQQPPSLRQLQLSPSPRLPRGQPDRQPTVNQPPVSNPADQFALRTANHTRLAHVLTGLADVDDVARAGLEGLTRVLIDRTSLEPAEPMGVDLTRDELAFFPMLYWPIDPRAPMPSREAIARADQFMKNGGTIIFDTRDQSEARPSPRGGFDTPGLVRLRQILASIDVPELEPVPSDHVLTKAFYIVTGFPGRFEDGPLWTERTAPNPAGVERPVRLADGVTPILITTNDFAGAWATDGRGGALLPLYGQNPRQREFALRVGVNIMMHLLTGNYKADQVHVPDILQRLGQ
jgi:hypothetical protein